MYILIFYITFLCIFLHLLSSLPPNKKLSAAIFTIIYLISFITVHVFMHVANPTHTLTIYIQKYIQTFMLFLLIYTPTNEKSRLTRTNPLIDSIRIGFTCGLVTPPLDLFIYWSPIILKHVGVSEDIAMKLGLESFQVDLITSMQAAMPMAFFGAASFVLLHYYNNALKWLYKHVAIPLWKDIKTWFFDVFRY